MKKYAILALLLSSLLTGCAAMFTGTNDNISVTTDSRNNTIFVNNQAIGKGSANFVVKRKDLGKTVISVKQEGCQTVQKPVEGSFNPVTLLGILIDYGLISILVIDGAATGAWQQPEQKHYYLNPMCS